MLHHRTAAHMEESTNCSLLHTYGTLTEAHIWLVLKSVHLSKIIYRIVGKSE